VNRITGRNGKKGRKEKRKERKERKIQISIKPSADHHHHHHHHHHLHRTTPRHIIAQHKTRLSPSLSAPAYPYSDK